MSGFDNGTLHSGLSAQVKQAGSIIRGLGPPVPGAGVTGDVYLDTQTSFLYVKRDLDAAQPWGYYLFQVPATYVNTLKWFDDVLPSDDVGVPGDYALAWAGFGNYGLNPSVYGPKQATAWAEGGNGPQTQIDPNLAGVAWPLGIADESTASAAWSTSTQLIAVGVDTEYVLAIPLSPISGSFVFELGMQSQPAAMVTNLNPFYAATDSHGV